MPHEYVRTKKEVFDYVREKTRACTRETAEQLTANTISKELNISRALAIKVEEGLFDVEEAKRIGKMMFYDTPKKLFRLKNV